MLWAFPAGCDERGKTMKNARRAMVAAVIALSSIAVAAPPASACAETQPCATINLVCQTVLRRPCLR